MAEDRKEFAELMAMSTIDGDGDVDNLIGLDSLYDLELKLRKLDLAQIGYLFLSQIGEANHGSWDSVPREELIGVNNFFRDMSTLITEIPESTQLPTLPWGFGGEEHWDALGIRHVSGAVSNPNPNLARECIAAAVKLYFNYQEPKQEIVDKLMRELESYA